jgi:hypothetical protein
VVDDEVLNGATAAFDLEAEAVHYSEDRDDRVGVLSIVSYCTTIVRFVLWVRLAEPEANVPFTIMV